MSSGFLVEQCRQEISAGKKGIDFEAFAKHVRKAPIFFFSECQELPSGKLTQLWKITIFNRQIKIEWAIFNSYARNKLLWSIVLCFVSGFTPGEKIVDHYAGITPEDLNQTHDYTHMNKLPFARIPLRSCISYPNLRHLGTVIESSIHIKKNNGRLSNWFHPTVGSPEPP